jgi:SAM-dependent methyltransferase
MTGMSDPGTDREALTTKLYATGANLAARAGIYRWQVPPFDLVPWVLGQVDWTGTERVLDVGCGYGAYLAELTLRAEASIGVDLSPGMLAEARGHGVPVANADSQALPFPAGTFDVVLAAHMLYHLLDVSAGVKELRRVLRPGGAAVAVTNAADDKPELLDLIDRAAGTSQGYRKVDTRFLLHPGCELFRQVFGGARVVDVRTAMAIPEAQPVMSYLASIRSTAEPALGVDWDAFLQRARRLVIDEIDANGQFVITTHAGVIVAP